jgi:4-aminobutyrate aminotransferase
MNRASEGDINTSEARKDWQGQISNPETLNLLDIDAKYFLHQGMSTPCLDVLQKCKGAKLSNLDGKEFFDFHGNNVHQMGYGHPRIKQALIEQIESLPFSPRRFTNETAVQFAEKLASLCPSDLNRVLMTPNGSSAIGIALKIARGITGKFKVLSFWDSFHGASLDAISVGGEAVFRDRMGPLLPGVERIPPPTTYRGMFADDYEKCLEYIEYVIEKEGDFGAFIGETIRNTDVQIPHQKFWKEVRDICDKHNILLILDEVPIAFGRTGKMFAFENFEIEPDILCLGKGLGAGIFPQACVVTRDRFNVFQDISLGHYTHEKSPLGARVALEQMAIIEEEKLLDKVMNDHEYMSERLLCMMQKYPLIGDVRGIGLLWGVEFVKNHETREKALEETEFILYECLRNGLSFKISGGNVVQLSPPITISREELEEAMAIFETSVARFSSNT